MTFHGGRWSFGIAPSLRTAGATRIIRRGVRFACVDGAIDIRVRRASVSRSCHRSALPASKPPNTMLPGRRRVPFAGITAALAYARLPGRAKEAERPATVGDARKLVSRTAGTNAQFSSGRRQATSRSFSRVVPDRSRHAAPDGAHEKPRSRITSSPWPPSDVVAYRSMPGYVA